MDIGRLSDWRTQSLTAQAQIWQDQDVYEANLQFEDTFAFFADANNGLRTFVTAVTDVAAVVAAIGDYTKLEGGVAIVSLINDHSIRNILLTGAGLIPRLSLPAALMTANIDLLTFEVQTIGEGMIEAIPGNTMDDGNGLSIPNPGQMDGCQAAGGCQ
jgi:hypothetical protein